MSVSVYIYVHYICVSGYVSVTVLEHLDMYVNPPHKHKYLLCICVHIYVCVYVCTYVYMLYAHYSCGRICLFMYMHVCLCAHVWDGSMGRYAVYAWVCMHI